MNDQSTFAGSPPVHRWRTHCRKAPELFEPLSGAPVDRRQAERQEALAVAQLTCEFETAEVRAMALRTIVMLRDCSVRQVSMFFDIDSAVVVLALSLLENSNTCFERPEYKPALVKAA